MRQTVPHPGVRMPRCSGSWSSTVLKLGVRFRVSYVLLLRCSIGRAGNFFSGPMSGIWILRLREWLRFL